MLKMLSFDCELSLADSVVHASFKDGTLSLVGLDADSAMRIAKMVVEREPLAVVVGSIDVPAPIALTPKGVEATQAASEKRTKVAPSQKQDKPQSEINGWGLSGDLVTPDDPPAEVRTSKKRPRVAALEVEASPSVETTLEAPEENAVDSAVDKALKNFETPANKPREEYRSPDAPPNQDTIAKSAIGVAEAKPSGGVPYDLPFMQAQSNLTVIVKHLVECGGAKSVEDLIALCEKLKTSVPRIGRVSDIRDRMISVNLAYDFFPESNGAQA